MEDHEELFISRDWSPERRLRVWDDEYNVHGEIEIEVINGNVVITVTREDEAKFGPVSVVVI